MNNTKVYKRFMVFAYADYYPSGGLYDVEADFDEIADAYEWTQSRPGRYENVAIFDRVDGREVSLPARSHREVA